MDEGLTDAQALRHRIADLERELETSRERLRRLEGRQPAAREERTATCSPAGARSESSEPPPGSAPERHGCPDERRFRRVFEANLMGIAFFRRDGTLGEANDRFLAIVGRSHAELRGGSLSLVTLTAEDCRPPVESALRTVVAEGSCRPFETVLLGASGRRISVLMGWAPLRPDDEDGVCFVLDIQARIEAIQRLRSAERRYRTLFEQSPDAVVVYDPETLLPVEFNRLAPKLLGYRPEELRSARIPDLEANESPEEVRDHVKHVLERGGDEFLTRLRRRDGTVRDFRVIARVLEIEGRRLLSSILRDETEARSAQAAATESEQRLRLIADSLPAVVAYVDADQRFQFVNRRYAEWFGRSPGEIVGRQLSEVLGRRRFERVRQSIEQRVLRGEPVSLEAWTRLASGELRWTLDKYVPDRGEDGVRGFFLLIIDLTEQKRVEDELRENRRRLVEAQRIASLGSWVWTVETGELSWSDEIYRIFGLDPAVFQATYYTFLERVHPDDRRKVQDGVADALAGRSRYSIDHRILLPSGQIKIVHEDAEVRFDAAGRAVQMAGTVQDVTDRKAIEDELRDKSEQLKLLLESLPVVSYSRRADADSPGLCYVSQSVFGLTGFLPQHFLQSPTFWLERVHPEDRPRVHRELSREDRTLQLEYRWQVSDGSYRWLADFGRRATRRGGEHVVGIWQDITDRLRAEAVLRRQSQIIDQVHDAVVACDLDGRINLWNAGAERLYGWRDEQILGEHLAALFLGASPLEIERSIIGPLLERGYLEQEAWNESREGELLFVHQSFSLFRDESGRTSGLVAYSIDITDRKRAEERARQHQEELTHVARVSTLGEMATGIAHEINQPLTAIGNFAAACQACLAEVGLDRDELLALVSEIEGQAHRAGRIIRRLRDLVRRSEPRREPVDVRFVVEEVVALVRSDARYHEVELELELDSRRPRVLGDRIQLEQVLMNLIKNAFEAVAQEPIRRVRVHTRLRDDGGTELSVMDTGRGFAGEDPERLFEAFFTHKEKGMGMGLAICRSIVEAHGGQVKATTDVGGGAVFRVLLPTHDTAGEKELESEGP